MHNKYLEIAQHDLKASECLYKNGFYPQALFFFQQSAEKTAKSFSYRYGLSDAEVKQASHSSVKIYKGIIKSVLTRIDIFAYHLIANKLDKMSGEYENMSDEELVENVLEGLDQLMQNELYLEFDINDDIEIARFIRLLQNETIHSPFIAGLTVKFVRTFYFHLMKSENKNLRDWISLSICTFLIVFKLNIVSKRLVSEVRYLTSPEDVIPELKYIFEHPFVGVLLQMTDALRYAHQHLSLILNTKRL